MARDMATAANRSTVYSYSSGLDLPGWLYFECPMVLSPMELLVRPAVLAGSLLTPKVVLAGSW